MSNNDSELLWWDTSYEQKKKIIKSRLGEAALPYFRTINSFFCEMCAIVTPQDIVCAAEGISLAKIIREEISKELIV